MRTVDTMPAWQDPTARLFGAIALGGGSSIWPYVVARAEIHGIAIGEYSNIQDFAMLHVGYETGVVVGRYCSIAHRATLHGCTVGDACLIGVGAVVMDGATIGRGSIVGEQALVRPGTVVPPGSIVVGSPARIVASRDSTVANIENALRYHVNALAYAEGRHRAWERLDAPAIHRDAVRAAATLTTDAAHAGASVPEG